ncbi:MAG: holo-ACP synthase [Chlamydiales bacterium]|nr:holo-ACP synthase [Chlamydiales bacterium]
MSEKHSSILGIGNDIVEIERISESISEHGSRFLERVFTEKERAYCLKHQAPAPNFAARFSAKEAISKALGVGIGEHLSWQDIEIINNEKGRPQVFFSARAKKTFNDPQIHLSISHCKLYVTAVAIWTH